MCIMIGFAKFRFLSARVSGDSLPAIWHKNLIYFSDSRMNVSKLRVQTQSGNAVSLLFTIWQVSLIVPRNLGGLTPLSASLGSYASHDQSRVYCSCIFCLFIIFFKYPCVVRVCGHNATVAAATAVAVDFVYVLTYRDRRKKNQKLV